MSGLFHTLSSVSRALEAQRFGLEVTGQNIANVNTAGYARRQVTFESVAPVDTVDAGGGVRVSGMQAVRDSGLERRLLMARPGEQRDGAIAQALSVVEVAIGVPGTSVDESLNAFFDAWADLAADPTSTVARLQVVTRAGDLAGAFHDVSGRLDETRRDADAQVRMLSAEVNALSKRIADLNAQIGGMPPGDASAEALRDEQRTALTSLAELVDIATIDRSDGGVDVALGCGRALVVGKNSRTIDARSAGPDGLATLHIGDYDITADVTGGRIGGLLHVRDALVPGYQQQLDELAAAVVREVNLVHESGFDLAGNPAGSLFAPLAVTAGAAELIAVDGAIASDPSKVAAAGTAATSDNQVARALAAFRDARVMNGGRATFADAWGEITYQVGSDARSAQERHRSQQAILGQIEALNDAVSGVSLDEEAMMMLRFQRAYEANARFFKVIDETIETLLSMAVH